MTSYAKAQADPTGNPLVGHKCVECGGPIHVVPPTVAADGCRACISGIPGDACCPRCAPTRSPRREQPPAPPAAEFYGEQPPNEALPNCLPAGTQWRYGGHTFELRDVSMVRVTDRDRPAWMPARFVNRGNPTAELIGGPGTVLIYAERVDWKTVRKSPPAPSQAERIPFKVGDWVEFTNAVGERIIGCVTSVDARGVDLLTTTRISQKPTVTGVLFSDGLRKWQPQPGEMCEGSFGDGGDELWRGRFSHFDDDNDAWLTDSNYTGGADVCVKGSTLRPLASISPSRDEKTPEPTTTPARSNGVAPAVENTGQLTETEIAAAMLVRNAEYRKKVAALRLDMDRPLPVRGKWDWDPEDADSELRVS